MFHRFGHASQHFVKLGDKVKKGQKILAIGTGNGQWSAHCHYDCPIKVLKNWTSYVFGWTVKETSDAYVDPTKNIPIAMPEYDHLGYGYLEHANYGTSAAPKWCYHPGLDLNGKGSGNADFGDPIYSPCDGVVIFDFDDGKALDGGWGRLLVIQEDEAPKIVLEPVVVADAPKIDEVVPIPVKVETSEQPMQTYADLDKPMQDESVSEVMSDDPVEEVKADPVEKNPLQIFLNWLADFIVNFLNKK